MEAQGSLYYLGQVIDLNKTQLEGFSKPKNSNFLWGSFQGFSIFIFSNGRMRVVYSSDPAGVANKEVLTINRVVEQLNSRFDYNINTEELISSKSSDELNFFFDYDRKLLDASIIIAAYVSSVKIHGDFKTQRMFELVGSSIGDELLKAQDPTNPEELFQLLSQYFNDFGYGSMEFSRVESAALDAPQFSITFTNTPFSGFIQSRALSVVIQNIVKSAYIRFLGQLNVFVKISKSWYQGDDNLVLEVGLRPV